MEQELIDFTNWLYKDELHLLKYDTVELLVEEYLKSKEDKICSIWGECYSVSANINCRKRNVKACWKE